jgi:hypothetical protein
MTETEKKRPLEARAGMIVLRVIAAALFILYLATTSTSALAWMQTYWTRQQPLATVSELLQESLAKNDPQILSLWIFRRPMADMPEIFAAIEPKAELISSLIFMRQAQYFMGNKQPGEALFWYLHARYRLRFDALRCGAPTGPETMNTVLNMLSPPDIEELVPAEGPDLAAELQRVLDYDAKMPAKNNPTDICEVLNRISRGNFVMVPEEHWAGLRHTLRLATEESLRQMREEPKGI